MIQRTALELKVHESLFSGAAGAAVEAGAVSSATERRALGVAVADMTSEAVVVAPPVTSTAALARSRKSPASAYNVATDDG